MMPEEFAHRIETLVKVTKLLGDKYREQENKINRLFDEMAQLRIEMVELKDKFQQKATLIIPSPPMKEEVLDAVDDTKTQLTGEETLSLRADEEKQVVQTSKSIEKDSEKKDLIDALKVIENL